MNDTFEMTSSLLPKVLLHTTGHFNLDIINTSLSARACFSYFKHALVTTLTDMFRNWYFFSLKNSGKGYLL